MTSDSYEEIFSPFGADLLSSFSVFSLLCPLLTYYVHFFPVFIETSSVENFWEMISFKDYRNSVSVPSISVFIFKVLIYNWSFVYRNIQWSD